MSSDQAERRELKADRMSVEGAIIHVVDVRRDAVKDREIRAARAYKLFDERELFMLVTPSGSESNYVAIFLNSLAFRFFLWS
jgi:hypothetical protein